MSRATCNAIIVSSILLVLLSSSGCSKESQNSPSSVSSGTISHDRLKSPDAAGGVVAQSAILSPVEHLHRSQDDDQKHLPKYDIVVSEQGRGAAYIADQDGKQVVVHNGSPGDRYDTISHLTISPDGQHVSYSVTLGNYVQMVSDGVQSMPFVDVYDAVYSPDSRHVAYLAEGRDLMMQIVLDGKPVEIARNVVSGNSLFSKDSAKLLYQTRTGNGREAHLVIYDLKTGKKVQINCLDTVVVMNTAKDRVAAVATAGDKQQVIDFPVADPEHVHKSGVYDAVSSVTIGGDDKTVAFVGDKGKHRYLVLNGKEDPLPDDMVIYDSPPVIQPDLKGAGIILSSRERYDNYYIFHQTSRMGGTKPIRYGLIQEPVYCRQNGTLAYAAMRDGKYFIVLNGKEGPAFDAVVSLKISPDGTKLIYRAREGAKRFVVVADVQGKEHRRQPAYEMVFVPVFTPDGKAIAYGVKDGSQLAWKVEKL